MITIDRTYTKLIEVLGDVGGLMEFLFSFLKILSLFLTEALYEKGLVNHLFSFDLYKKVISVKSLKKNNNKNASLNESPYQPKELYTPIIPSAKLSFQNSINSNDEIKSKNILNEDFPNKIKNDDIIIAGIVAPSKGKKKKKKVKRKATISSKQTKIENIEVNSLKPNLDNMKNQIIEKSIDLSCQNKETNKDCENKNIIDKVNFSKVDKFVCFFCIRKRTNLQNILIDEGMELVSEYLDVINIFKRAHLENKLLGKIDNEDFIEMSDECKKGVQKVYKSYFQG